MNAKPTNRPTAKQKPQNTAPKRPCGTCGRKLCRIWDRETLTTEFLCVFCTCFVPTNRR